MGNSAYSEYAGSEFTPFMHRAIQIAKNGPEFDKNPRVGCVLLDSNNQPIGEGWHMGSGSEHAEVMALRSVGSIGKAALGSAQRDTTGKNSTEKKPHTAIVTLEPCSRTGRTGPCTQALIAAGIKRVVFSISDPHSDGYQTLTAAGIQVISGLLSKEVYDLCQRWFLPEEEKIPWVIAKWGQSLDGKTAAADGSSRWITSPYARSHLHLLRSQVDAIAVGSGTLVSDNPSLLARSPAGRPYAKQPIPVLFTSLSPAQLGTHRLAQRNPLILSGKNLRRDLQNLFALGIRSLLLEGGMELLSSFIRSNLVHEYYIYLAPKLLGGTRATLHDIGVNSIAESINLDLAATIPLGDNLLIKGRLANTTKKTRHP